jgi:hypothetical protein
MRKSIITASILAFGAIALSACGHAKESLGLAKVTPDEFRVVTKAPLVLPPDYDMRPPAPGEPRPQELQPESAARLALLGQNNAEQRSEGEKLLVQRAGVARADPLARYVVDDEFGAIAYKDKSFADKILFWRKASPDSASDAAHQVAPIDPAAENQRLRALTGGKPIVIKKQVNRRKLPGL